MSTLHVLEFCYAYIRHVTFCMVIVYATNVVLLVAELWLISNVFWNLVWVLPDLMFYHFDVGQWCIFLLINGVKVGTIQIIKVELSNTFRIAHHHGWTHKRDMLKWLLNTRRSPMLFLSTIDYLNNPANFETLKLIQSDSHLRNVNDTRSKSHPSLSENNISPCVPLINGIQLTLEPWICSGASCDHLRISQFGLRECVCANASHHRLIKGNMRTIFESYFIERVTKLIQSRSKQSSPVSCLTILSLGSGGLLSDFLLICKCVDLGIRQFEWICVDIDFRTDFYVHNIRLLVEYWNRAEAETARMCRTPSKPPIHINIQSVRQISHCRLPPLDFVIACDFDDVMREGNTGWNDLLIGQQALKSYSYSEFAEVILSFGRCVWSVSKEKILRILNEEYHSDLGLEISKELIDRTMGQPFTIKCNERKISLFQALSRLPSVCANPPSIIPSAFHLQYTMTSRSSRSSGSSSSNLYVHQVLPQLIKHIFLKSLSSPTSTDPSSKNCTDSFISRPITFEHV